MVRVAVGVVVVVVVVVVVRVAVGVAVVVRVGVVVGVVVVVGVGVAVGVAVGVVVGVGVNMDHPKEGGHFYYPDGRQAYSVKAKAGHDRPVTLRDARTLGLVPGVTGIIRQAAAPGLERWKRQQLAYACLTLPRIEGESEDAFLERAERDAEEQGRKARDKGTAIHAELEGFYREALSPVDYPREVQAVVDLLAMQFPGARWVAEKSFATDRYGCKIDLCSAVPQPVVLDFKTKEFDESDDFTKLAWDEQAMQIVANADAAFPESESICGNVFVSTSVPGLVHLHIWTEEQQARAYRMFNALLDFYYAKTGLGEK